MKTSAASLILGIILLLSAIGCGGSSGDDSTMENPETPVDTLVHLQVIDSIGVELGQPEYVFGNIVEAERLSDGDVLVLDASTMNLRRFDETGSFIESAGRQGTGPGEFQMPRGMTVLSDGSVIVSDMAGGAVSVFSDSLAWTMSITNFFPRPPFTVRPAGDSAFVGMMPAFDREEGLMGYSIARLEMDSEPAVVYSEEMMPFDPSRIGPLGDEQEPIFTSDNSGRVFIAQAGTDAIDITGYLPGGEVFMTIQQDVERVEKSQEELAEEEEEFQEFSSRMGGRGRMGGGEVSFDPVPYRRAVSDLGVDSEDRLWVRIGTYRYPFFRVYDMEGKYLFSASLSTDNPDLDDLVVRITQNGMTAWVPDPTTWPRIYVIESAGAAETL